VALERIAEFGGVVIYMRGHEGRGIGLVAKLKAYRLQESGLDTLDANVALGFVADSRTYSAAAAILADLNVQSVRLLTNNPDKIAQLTASGIDVVERVPLLVGEQPANREYLRAKRDRMGHLLAAEA
jgi:3,4-dihydroxy 2-butanone 4-phosphate synthase/GTP cyclohydrolase II